MSFSGKQRKKLTKKLFRIEDKQDIILTEIVLQYFVIFCIILLFDQIVEKILFPYLKLSKGIGFVQYLMAGGCLLLMVRLWRKMSK